MNKTKLHTIALFMILIVIMLPIIEAQQVSNNNPTTTTQIITDIPRYSKQTIIDISGTTTPNATIELYIQTVKRRQTTSDNQGRFEITDTHLPYADNEILIKTTDSQGNTAEQQYTTTVDTKVPNFKILNFTSIATEQTTNIQAETDKPLNITYTVTQTSDTTPPDKITNPKKERIEQDIITISWDATTAIDFLEYAVYRNDKRIAITQTPDYTDTKIEPRTEYNYKITTADKNCNESPKSDTLLLKSLQSTSQTQDAQELPLGCEPQQQTLQIDQSGTFSIPVQLKEGTNEITITATDLAGHKIEYTNSTTLDLTPPEIIETNLEQLTPTYIPDVTIKGTLNKKASVLIYINDIKKPVTHTTSDDRGNFEAKIQLRRDVQLTTTKTSVSLATGEGWKNTIKIEAIDLAGRKSNPVTGDITYSLCGYGNWFDVTISEPSPKKLTPRLLIQGIQETGLIINATYKGKNEVTLGQITANPIMLSPDLEPDYDNGIVDLNLITQAQNPKSFVSYLQAMFKPWPFPEDTTMTVYDKEQNISRHRMSLTGPKGTAGIEKYGKKKAQPYVSSQYKNCLTPGIGCAKLFLQIDIPFQEKIPRQTTKSSTERFELQNHVQKTCMPIELMMDVPVPPKLVPKNFLKSAIKFLDSAVEMIDTVLNPLTTIGTYVIYACMAGTAWLYIDEVRLIWACDTQEIISTATSAVGQGEQFDKTIAEAGLCDQAYSGSLDARNKCNSCKDAIDRSKQFQYEILQPICDRVACPSAPTTQTYIKQAHEIKEVPGVTDTLQHFDFSKWNVNGKVYTGNDCGFIYQTEANLNKLSLTYASQTQTSTLGLKDLFEINAGKSTKPGPTKEDCEESYTRPAHPNCCGTTYMQEWAGACGPAPLLDTFDELEQSACLSAQNANQKTSAEDSGLQCGGVLNSVAGFCEPNTGGEVVDPIQTGIRYTDKPVGTAISDDVYVLVTPAGNTQTGNTRYTVNRGYITTKYTTGTTTTTGQNEIPVNANTIAINDGTDLTQYFQQEQENTRQKDTAPNYGGFAQALCAGNIKQDTCTQAKAKELYDRIYEKIGATDKEYIVKPDQEGILRSIQCVCLPAVTSYLQFWKNIMSTVRDCFKTILLTGDGSEGVCKAVLSTYVCDLLFDVVKCFVQKFNSPGAGTRASGGIGDFLSAFTQAGNNIQQKINGRYGETALWKTMFVDKKLVHSICAFAFTGKWNFDASTIFQQTVDSIPIQSQAFLPKCERQYIAYKPTTDPQGKTTWTYHFGIGLAAGADVRYDLMLKCSTGFRCDPADGYKNGECDCNKKGEQTITIFEPELGTGQLKKNDILNTEIWHTIQAESTEATTRYDKAILKYSYTDPTTNKETTEQAECSIKLTGGDAPNFCQFDPFTLSYRCSFGIGDSAVRLNDAQPVYAENDVNNNVKMYGLNSKINIKLDVEQRQPLERARSAEGQKYIFYTLKNEIGRVLTQTKEMDAFLTGDQLRRQDGQFDQEITLQRKNTNQQPEIPLKITDKDFGIEGGKPYTQTIINAPYSTINQPTETSIINSFTVTTTSGTPPATQTTPPTQLYILEFKNKELTIYNAGSGSTTRTGEFNKATDITTPSMPTVGTITLTDKTTPTTKYNIGLTEIPQNAQILIQPAPGTNPCITKQPVLWTADIEIHDSDRQGRSTQQVSVEPGTGTQAKKTTTIQAVCAELTTAGTTTTTTATPTSTTTPTTTTPAPATPPTTPPATQLLATTNQQRVTLNQLIIELGRIKDMPIQPIDQNINQIQNAINTTTELTQDQKIYILSQTTIFKTAGNANARQNIITDMYNTLLQTPQTTAPTTPASTTPIISSPPPLPD